MIDASSYQGKKVAVFGLARSGIAAAKALSAGGAEVFAWDDGEAARHQSPVTPVDLYERDFSDLDALCVAPGVPLTHPVPHPLVKKARAANLPVIGDMEIFANARKTLPNHHVIAITGTNGKSTTTALTNHILASAGRPTCMGGNIGTAVLSLEPLEAGGTYVFEFSSYQIDLTESFAADVAILLNLSPDHLDRHGDMAGYAGSKARLFAMQGEAQVAIISADDQHCREIAASIDHLVVPVSVKRSIAGGVYVADGILMDAMGVRAVPVLSLATCPALVGIHNHQNAAAAYAALRVLGLERDAIAEGLRSFAGLAHRMERVATLGRVNFVNDSKATNLDAAARALASYDRIYWIAGGRAKETDLTGLAPYFPNIAKAYLIGEAAKPFADGLGTTIATDMCGTLQSAVALATRDALADNFENAVVLLSPGCASFDQFPDFEVRGEAFRDMVCKLIDGGAS